MVTVKAELAGRLVRSTRSGPRRRSPTWKRLAREALADVRDAVSGYREVSLAGELASARTALAAAGIEAELPTAVDEVPADRQRAVRLGGPRGRDERGTAQQRQAVPDPDHAQPRSRSPTTAGARAGAGRRLAGHGLAGLRERAEAAGGSLSVGRSPEGGFALRVRVP